MVNTVDWFSESLFFNRGDVIIAGYVFKSISTDPPEVELTYVTRADLKGKIIEQLKAPVSFWEKPILYL